MRLRLLFAACVCLLAVPAAHAEDDVVWDMQGQGPFPASSYHLASVEQTMSGARVVATEDGVLLWNTRLPHPVDVISIETFSTHPTQGAVLWHVTFGNNEIQDNFTVPAGRQTVNIPLRDHPAWNWQSNQFGIGIAGGSDVTIRRLTWRRYSLAEKIGEGWRSFWTFDEDKVYSINFLWGPLLAFNPTSRATLFAGQPPPSWSADRLFYLLLIAALATGACCAFVKKRNGKRLALQIVGGTFIALWLLFDLRMGSELISYATTDLRTYVLKPGNDGQFRAHAGLHALIRALLPDIRRYDSFVVIQPPDTPFYATLRYVAYPSIAMLPGDHTSNVKLWLVMLRSDVHLDAANRLVDGQGTVLSPPGRIVEHIDAKSFIFVTP